MSEDRISEGDAFKRHDRIRGAVLIVGVGAVGGFIAEDLAAIGISPLRLVDPDTFDVENVVRHSLRRSSLGGLKASTLAGRLHDDFPWCDAEGFDRDFLKLPTDLQRQLVEQAQVVVVAAETEACRLRVNELCTDAEVPAEDR